MNSEQRIIHILSEIVSGYSSVSKASKEYGVTRATIYSWFRRVGVKVPKRQRTDWAKIRKEVTGEK